MLLMIVLEGKHKSIKIMVIFFGSILIITNLKKKIKTIDNFTIEIIMDTF